MIDTGIKEILETYKKLGGIEKIVDRIDDRQQRIEDKIDSLVARLITLESDLNHLKDTLKAEVLTEVGVTFAELHAKVSMIEKLIMVNQAPSPRKIAK